MTTLLLIASIVLSTARNLLSRGLSRLAFGTREFFTRQGTLFGFGALALLIFGTPKGLIPSPETLLYAFLYGALLILSQWFYTMALGGGNTALCSTVYSMGFIIPTISGVLFWSEPFSILDTVGIVAAISAILCAGEKTVSKEGTSKYFLPLILATLASGGLGVMQKVQQKSSVAGESSLFLLIAFVVAMTLSFACSITAKKACEHTEGKGYFLMAGGIGIAFGVCNLLNTALAGILPSAIFFPTLNIGSILLTLKSEAKRS